MQKMHFRPLSGKPSRPRGAFPSPRPGLSVREFSAAPILSPASQLQTSSTRVEEVLAATPQSATRRRQRPQEPGSPVLWWRRRKRKRRDLRRSLRQHVRTFWPVLGIRRWPFPSCVVAERSSGGLWSSSIMAEITQERLEDRLPELQQLERTGLFSEAEIR